MNENESKKVPEVVLAPLTGKAVPLSDARKKDILS